MMVVAAQRQERPGRQDGDGLDLSMCTDAVVHWVVKSHACRAAPLGFPSAEDQLP